MSGFKKHALSGRCAGAVVGAGVGYISGRMDVAMTFGLFTIIGSILPDIDTGSIPSRLFAIATVVVAGVFMYRGMDKHAAIVGLLNAITRIDKHRGFMHSYILIIACFIIGAMGCVGKIHMYYSVLAPLSFGMFIHIILLDRDF